jgi:hypothetical protein
MPVGGNGRSGAMRQRVCIRARALGCRPSSLGDARPLAEPRHLTLARLHNFPVPRPKQRRATDAPAG